MKLYVKYHNGVNKIERIKKGDWIDLRAAERIRLKAGDFALISLGVSIKLPKGYEALVVPRSSLFKNHGVIQTNSIGVIDESYCGDNDIWKFPVLAFRDTTIEKDERICQFRIIKHQPRFNIIKSFFLGKIDRGGFGTTGVK